MPRARPQRGASGLRTPDPPRKRPRFIQKDNDPPYHISWIAGFLLLLVLLLLLLV